MLRGLIGPSPSFFSLIFETSRMFSPKTDLTSKNCGIFYDYNVVYFEDTLANVGLHEARLEWDLNFVT